MERYAGRMVYPLLLAYVAALVVSAGHLAQWYALTSGGLPGWFALGLAVSLELTAFLLSLISNLVPRARWAVGGALGALGLVWGGNLLAMARVEGLAGWEVFLQSLFVPVSTLVVGKVIGELLRLQGPAGGRPAAEPPREAAPPAVALAPGGDGLAPVRHAVPAHDGPERRGEPMREGDLTAASLVQQASRITRTRIEVAESVEHVALLEGLPPQARRALQLIEQGHSSRGELMRALGVGLVELSGIVGALEARGLVRANGQGWERR